MCASNVLVTSVVIMCFASAMIAAGIWFMTNNIFIAYVAFMIIVSATCIVMVAVCGDRSAVVDLIARM